MGQAHLSHLKQCFFKLKGLNLVVKTVNLKDFSKEFRKFQKMAIEEQKSTVAKGVIDYLPEIIKSSPVDTGLFAQSWDLQESEVSILLGNYAPHAPIIEFGARPFKPPLGPLLAWAKRVLQDASQPPKYSSRVWALAIYTQKKIERVGMKPHNIMENAIPMIIENIKSELRLLA
jgi:hypothetical protein